MDKYIFMKKLLIFLSVLFTISCSMKSSENKIGIVIHGGAGTILKENMTFHCIPALWLKKYGIVISETFVVRKNGAERLTNYEQKLFDLEDFK